MSWSDITSIVSIVISVFALYQAHNEALRAEAINKQTMDNLSEIKSCLARIDVIIDKQQTRQLGIISDTTSGLLDTISKVMTQGDNTNGRE